eukprot:CAMPEP_0118972162 /NCGR_PEP_ID=MMETSP1173-20130426/8559_1 /TAXON_ID=1034831 /ORGANISM="Rhizochromulina marina cf, Strain CCMP1243" /LENGTH=205 /DNA_ID=CAMNT_0006921681 /DNA_START=54 /DNA_END=671 /DNA_ORIENTATION=-
MGFFSGDTGRFLLLLLSFLTLMIAFAITSSAECSDENFDFDDSTSLSFAVGMGVIIWAFTLFALVVYASKLIPSLATKIPMSVDADSLCMKNQLRISAIMVYTCAVTSGSSNTETLNDDAFCDLCEDYCERTTAGSFFFFMAFFMFIAVVVIQDYDLVKACCSKRPKLSSQEDAPPPSFAQNYGQDPYAGQEAPAPADKPYEPQV